MTNEVKVFIDSAEQTQYYNWIDTGRGSAVVESVAGSGKTTTALRGLARMRGSVYMGMFNKKIAVEAKEKAHAMGLNLAGKFIGTMHSAGYSAWRRYLGSDANSIIIDDQKTRLICEKLNVDEVLVPYISKMTSFGKQLLVPHDRDGRGHWEDINEHFGADSVLTEDVDMDEVYAILKTVYSKSHQVCREIMDFDDMIYAPIVYNVNFYQNDWVIIDEAQDTNPARRELARRMLKRNGRLVAFGDRHQALYGFTGADSDSLDLIAKKFDCARLALTVSYRCPQEVVSRAQQYVSHIQASDTAPRGHVDRISATTLDTTGARVPWFVAATPTKYDAILCRYTKPLVQTAYGMIKAGIPCRVEGRDIGKNLIALATRWKVRTLDALENRLEIYLAREIKKAVEKRRDSIRQTAEDRVDTLRIFIQKCQNEGKRTVDCVVASIEQLFADNVSGVTVLSTIHKAKGREWPTVYWMQVPDPQRELKDWETQSEINCKYVAITRAQDTLIYVAEG